MRLKQKLADMTGAVGKLFGRKQEKDPAVAKLDAVKVSYTATVALLVRLCEHGRGHASREAVSCPDRCMPMRVHGHASVLAP